MGRVSYSMQPSWRPLLFGTFAVFGIGGVILLAVTISREDGASLVFAALWVAAVLWNAYWWLLRISYRLELDGGQLRWFAPLRRGEIPLADLVSVGQAPISRQQARFMLAGTPHIYVMIRPGLTEFVNEIHSRDPRITVPKSGFMEPALRSGLTRNGFSRDN